MIRLGLVGAADARHRWFLAAAQRRRAGVRIVGVSDPDPSVREAISDRYDLPCWADHRAMLAATSPSLVAIAGSDPGPAVIDALQADADVLVTAPICASPDELDRIAELVSARGRRVTAAHTYRGHPAARTAAELAAQLGPPELVSLLLAGSWEPAALRSVIMEGLDLFGALTGVSSIHGRPIGAGHPNPEDDSEEIRTAYGELIMLATADEPGHGPTFEVRHRPDGTVPTELIQVTADGAAYEWDPRTGMMRSAIDGREPTIISCGRPDEPEWVLNNLIRKRRPVVATPQSLDLTRLLLSSDGPLLGPS